MMPKLGVLLGTESAIPAKNMATMRSIVEVLKRVSVLWEAEPLEKETRSKNVEIASPPANRQPSKTKSQNHAHRRRVQMMNTPSR